MIKQSIYIFFFVIFLNNCKGKADLSKESFLLILSKKGDVVLMRNNQEIAVEVSGFVMEGDTIRTGEASGIDLEFPNGALLRVKEKTSISITSILSQEDSQVEIALNRGKIFSKIKNKLKERDFYRIKTPTMVAGVRGTEFSISEEEIPKIMVLEGEVSAEKKSSPISSVSAGKKAEGDTLELSELSPEEKKELESDSISLIPSSGELKENAQRLLVDFKESQKTKNQDELTEQKEKNQTELDSQKASSRENLNTQIEKNNEELGNQTGKDKTNLNEQKQSGKKEANDMKAKSKDEISGVKKEAESEKDRINSTKNSMDAIKNPNLLESVKPKK